MLLHNEVTMMHNAQSMIVQGLLVDKPNKPKAMQDIFVSRRNTHHSSGRIYVYKGLTCYILV